MTMYFPIISGVTPASSPTTLPVAPGGNVTQVNSSVAAPVGGKDVQISVLGNSSTTVASLLPGGSIVSLA